MKITAFKNRNLTIFALALGLLGFGFNAAEQHFTAFYQTIGRANLAFISLAILYAAIVVGNFIGPSVARKLGIKISFILGFLAYTFLVFGITTKIPLLIFILSFSLGVGCGIQGIAQVDFLRIISPRQNRGEYAGAIETVRTFGGFLGIIAVSLLLKLLNISHTFILLGMVMLLGTALLFLLSSIKGEASHESERQNFKLMFSLIKDTKILLLLPKSIANGFLLGLVLGAIPVAIENKFGIGQVGIITSLFHLTLAIFMISGGYLSDIRNRFSPIYASIASSIIAALIFLNSSTMVSYVLVMILLGVGGSLGVGSSSALMLDTFEERVKEASAILGNLSLILGVIPSFILPTKLPQNQLFYLAIGLSILGIISLRVFEKKFSTKTI